MTEKRLLESGQVHFTSNFIISPKQQTHILHFPVVFSLAISFIRSFDPCMAAEGEEKKETRCDVVFFYAFDGLKLDIQCLYSSVICVFFSTKKPIISIIYSPVLNGYICVCSIFLF